MKTSGYISATLFFCLCAGLSNFCSQPALNNRSFSAVYEATTPCSESIIRMLKLSPDPKCGMLKWTLTLYSESNIQSPSSFDLVCTYGLPKQNSRGFLEGAKTVELKGKCDVRQGTPVNPRATVYNLLADSSAISLSFFRADQNLLHLLSDDKNLMVGGPGWSYMLSRKEPVYSASESFNPKPVSDIKLYSDAAIVGTFEGRIPCNSALKALQGIRSPDCNLIKCQLKLFQDSINHTPSTFILNTIYVGFGDNNIYSSTGTWKILQGTSADPAAIVYRLEPEQAKSQTPVLLQKADDNILFFLDNDTRLLTGNDYCSYTLNRKKE